jgi:adenylate kinase family enzyme
MKRIKIVGGPGSGKSTLAQQLGARLGLPVVHMDALYWQPGWVERPEAEVYDAVANFTQQESWVVDGSYSDTLDLRVARAEMIVFLNLPRRLRMWRLIRRTVRHFGTSRPDMAQGCPERFDRAFFAFAWNYDTDERVRMLRYLDRHAQIDIRHLGSRRQVARFLAKSGR